MARRKKLTSKERRRQRLTIERGFDWYNGGGTESYRIKCESCRLVQAGGEQYHDRSRPITPCVCGNETALYEPQLR